MRWTEKFQPTPFDDLPIHGLLFLDGDVMARAISRLRGDERFSLLVNPHDLKNKKYPMVSFPSGEVFAVDSPLERPTEPTLHLFGNMTLPVFSTRDETLKRATKLAYQHDYVVHPHGEEQLDLLGHTGKDYFRVTYDNAERRLADIQSLAIAAETIWSAPPLSLDVETRRRLPPLRSQEHLGLDALAQVKFFTPDDTWVWYASEFDGREYFFGLVSGWEVEFGSFSLSELREVRGRLGLRIERDPDFVPRPLGELADQHRRERHEAEGDDAK